MSTDSAINAVSGLANGASGATANAVDQAKSLANANNTANAVAVDKAKDAAKEAASKASALAGNATDSASNALASAKSTVAGATGVMGNASSMLSGGSIPSLKMPSLKAVTPNANIDKLTKTFDPSSYLEQQKSNLSASQAKINAYKEELAKQAAENAKKIEKENAAQQESYMDKLNKLGGIAEKLPSQADDLKSNFNSLNGASKNFSLDKITEVNDAKNLANAMKSLSSGKKAPLDQAKSVLSLLRRGQNSTLMSTGIKTANATKSASKVLFADKSGNISRAVAKQDTADGAPPRDNTPCGPNAEIIGGVNYNDDKAAKKADYLSLFKQACIAGDMDGAEKYWKILVHDQNMSPSLLMGDVATLCQRIPKNKCGNSRILDMFRDARVTAISRGETLNIKPVKYGVPRDYYEASFTDEERKQIEEEAAKLEAERKREEELRIAEDRQRQIAFIEKQYTQELRILNGLKSDTPTVFEQQMHEEELAVIEARRKARLDALNDSKTFTRGAEVVSIGGYDRQTIITMCKSHWALVKNLEQERDKAQLERNKAQRQYLMAKRDLKNADPSAPGFNELKYRYDTTYADYEYWDKQYNELVEKYSIEGTRHQQYDIERNSWMDRYQAVYPDIRGYTGPIDITRVYS